MSSQLSFSLITVTVLVFIGFFDLFAFLGVDVDVDVIEDLQRNSLYPESRPVFPLDEGRFASFSDLLFRVLTDLGLSNFFS